MVAMVIALLCPQRSAHTIADRRPVCRALCTDDDGTFDAHRPGPVRVCAADVTIREALRDHRPSAASPSGADSAGTTAGPLEDSVPTSHDLVELSHDECLRLLLTHRPRLGRLAFTSQGRVLVFPMNFVLVDRRLYFRTAPGSKLLAALRIDRVTFEVDHVDDVWREGWSVLAFGRLREVTDPEELADLAHRPLRPWAPGGRPHHLRMDIDDMSGRRID
jgi:nitroimidazol reductase NimA-like FMN-containing flavoprotein (pyridoxamine 5'-phosphate oxidase superfamily)